MGFAPKQTPVSLPSPAPGLLAPWGIAVTPEFKSTGVEFQTHQTVAAACAAAIDDLHIEGEAGGGWEG